MPVSGFIFDDIGKGKIWGDIEGYADDAVSGVSFHLPTPVYSVTYSSNSALIKVINTFTGYGDVTVRWKLGSEPADTDEEVGSSGLTVTADGLYYLRAFPNTGNTNIASGSAIARISIGG